MVIRRVESRSSGGKKAKRASRKFCEQATCFFSKVLQFYPENGEQLEMLTSAALRSGFGGGVVVDFPNSTKAKK